MAAASWPPPRVELEAGSGAASLRRPPLASRQAAANTAFLIACGSATGLDNLWGFGQITKPHAAALAIHYRNVCGFRFALIHDRLDCSSDPAA
jgi:hypothetical protein